MALLQRANDAKLLGVYSRVEAKAGEGKRKKDGHIIEEVDVARHRKAEQEMRRKRREGARENLNTSNESFHNTTTRLNVVHHNQSFITQLGSFLAIHSVSSGKSSVLLHEFTVELTNPAHPVRTGRQKGRSEMKRPLLLSKPRTGNETDTRCFEEAKTVEFVGGLVVFFGGGDGFVAEGYGGEEVHGALHGTLVKYGEKGGGETYSRSLTFHSLHLFESFIQSSRPLLQSLKSGIILFLVKLVTLFSLDRRMNHTLDDALSNHRRAKLD